MEVKNKFEDHRNLMTNLIKILDKMDKYYEPKDSEIEIITNQIELLIKQIVNHKNPKNFELFTKVFDILINNGIESDEGLSKAKNLNDELNKIAEQLNFGKEEEILTIKMAFRLYKNIREFSLKIYNIHIKEMNQAHSSENGEDSWKNRNNFNDIGDGSKWNNKDIIFDVFLSHRYLYKFYNLIIFYILTAYYKLYVYVDWIFDAQLNRIDITKNTVKTLQKRLKQSGTLVFFNIDKNNTTNWMAWEVGFYSAINRNIGILDLNDYCSGNRNVEVLSTNDILECDERGNLIEIRSGYLIDEWVYNCEINLNKMIA